MNIQQKAQIDFQSNQMKHKDYFVDIELGKNCVLKKFLVKENVLPPEKLTAIIWAKWIYENKYLFKEKNILDMGCGSGIQGISALKSGATKVTFSDISKYEFENTNYNLEQYNFKKNSKLFLGDLFEKINSKFDVILFNHPFFGVKPNKEDFIALATQDDGKLIHRFFDEVKNYLNDFGIIIMPFFDIAGETNNPQIQAKKHDFLVEKVFSKNIETILHKGIISFYIIRLNNKR
ncbi:MAG: Rossmann-like fold-containing protein [archaeon]|jgi:methylase of polypeptide subunit release factors